MLQQISSASNGRKKFSQNEEILKDLSKICYKNGEIQTSLQCFIKGLVVRLKKSCHKENTIYEQNHNEIENHLIHFFTIDSQRKIQKLNNQS